MKERKKEDMGHKVRIMKNIRGLVLRGGIEMSTQSIYANGICQLLREKVNERDSLQNKRQCCELKGATNSSLEHCLCLGESWFSIQLPAAMTVLSSEFMDSSRLGRRSSLAWEDRVLFPIVLARKVGSVDVTVEQHTWHRMTLKHFTEWRDKSITND